MKLLPYWWEFFLFYKEGAGGQYKQGKAKADQDDRMEY